MALLLLLPNNGVATIAPETVLPTIEQRIDHWAQFYGISASSSLAIAKCESNLSPTIFGDHDLAYSVYQFHLDTFVQFAKEAGERMEYDSIEDHIKLANWAFAHGKSNHWTCAKQLGLF